MKWASELCGEARKILSRALTKLSRIDGRRSRLEDRGSKIAPSRVRPSSTFDPRSSILNPRLSWLITRLGLLFLHELIGREFRVDLDLADLPLFVRRTAFNFGHAVREVKAAGALKIAERPAVIDLRSFLEPLLSFFSEAFAIFRSEFGSLSRLRALSWLSGLRALSWLSGLRALSWLSGLSRLSGLRALRLLSALTAARAAGAASASSKELFCFVTETDQLIRLLIEVEAHSEAISAFAVAHIEFAGLRAWRFADEV